VAVISTSDWSSEALPVTSIVPLGKLKSLTGMARGMPIWKSNNPEVFTSDGWLMQNARTSSRQLVGSARLSGNFGIYLFHINKSSATRIIHLLVTNPQNTSVQVSGKGSMFSNSTFPLLGQGTGLNYQVARNWLTDTHRVEFDAVNLAPNKAYSIDQHTLKSSNMVDGRFELTTTAPVFLYAVVLTALCPACHECKHMGFAYTQGRGKIAGLHLARVNGWSSQKADFYINSCFNIWIERSRVEWMLDISYLQQLGVEIIADEPIL
jgi:hypothetical protein